MRRAEVILAGFFDDANQLAKPINEVAPCRLKKKRTGICDAPRMSPGPGSVVTPHGREITGVV
jgi:hypothetical protein